MARMRYGVVLAPEAIQDLKGLSARDRSTVLDSIERHLRYEPTKLSRSRIKRLRGIRQPEYRLRVDEFRIFYDVAEETIEVLAIVKKSQAARWL